MPGPNDHFERKSVGEGTLNDPKSAQACILRVRDQDQIMWICDLPARQAHKIPANEVVCREACRLAQLQVCFIRSIVQPTTRLHGKRMKTDPHAAVYMSEAYEEGRWDYEGHVYVSEHGSTRYKLSNDDERQYVRGVQKPKLRDPVTKLDFALPTASDEDQ